MYIIQLYAIYLELRICRAVGDDEVPAGAAVGDADDVAGGAVEGEGAAVSDRVKQWAHSIGLQVSEAFVRRRAAGSRASDGER